MAGPSFEPPVDHVSLAGALAVDWELECVRLRQAQAISRVGSWHYGAADHRLQVSEALLQIHGLARADIGQLRTCVDSADFRALVGAFRRLLVTGVPLSVRYRAERPADGTSRWFDARGVALGSRSGGATELAGTVADVTELVDAERRAETAHAELSQAYRFQEAVIAATPDAIHVYEAATGNLTRANRTGAPLTGFTDEMVTVLGGSDLVELVPSDDRETLSRAFAQVSTVDAEVLRVRHRVRHPDGRFGWLSRRMTPFQRSDDGDVTHILVISRDVTDVVAEEQRLAHAALHDDLTGLPNRRLILNRLDHALQSRRRGGNTALLLCDLNGFKQINDTRGHAVGDQVLVETSSRLLAGIRGSDTAGRLGGDEFVVILNIAGDVDAVHQADEVAERLLSSLARPIATEAGRCTVTASIGISLADDSSTTETMLRDADSAMYQAKRTGLGRGQYMRSTWTGQRRDDPA